MSVYFNQDRQRWMYNFTLNGVRYQSYCLDEHGHPVTTKTAARIAEERARAAARKQGGTRPAPFAGFTLAQASAAMVARQKRPSANDGVYLRELLAYFGPQASVRSLDESRVWDYIAWARQQPVKIYVGGSRKRNRPPHELRRDSSRTRSDATINRYLACLRKLLRTATETRDPATGEPALLRAPKVPKLDEPQRLPRPISDADLARVIQRAPAHLADALALIAHMGFRKGEVFGLKVAQVDLELGGVWLAWDETKGRRDQFVHANEAAMAVLRRLVAQAKTWKVPQLISYRRTEADEPRPIKNPKSAWRRLMKELGLQHRFHDTRASFITALALSAPARVVQELARHRDFETTQRYIAVADEAKSRAIAAISDRAATAGMDLSAGVGIAPLPPSVRTQKSLTRRKRRKSKSVSP